MSQARDRADPKLLLQMAQRCLHQDHEMAEESNWYWSSGPRDKPLPQMGDRDSSLAYTVVG